MDKENPHGRTAGASSVLGRNCEASSPSRSPLQANVVNFRPAARPLRADVPPFDPRNQAHLRAWESMWDFSRMEARHG